MQTLQYCPCFPRHYPQLTVFAVLAPLTVRIIYFRSTNIHNIFGVLAPFTFGLRVGKRSKKKIAKLKKTTHQKGIKS